MRKLAESKISDLNFDRYTDMFDRQITRIDLQGFISSLEWLSQRSKVREVRAALGVEVRFLQTMVEVVEQVSYVGCGVKLKELLIAQRSKRFYKNSLTPI